jgi:SAM-dependent methyltransferase
MLTKNSLERWWPLFLISGLGLFFELALIRWVSSEIRLLSYFKNLPLLAAFLGLALGYALAGKSRDFSSTFAPVLTVLVALAIFVGRIASPLGLAYPGSADEFLWYTASLSYWAALLLFLGVVAIFFLLTMFVFIPLGQATGEELARHAPVPAYVVNIVASLAGVWLFALLSLWQTPPVIWFGLGLLGLLVFWLKQKKLTRRSIGLYGLILVGLGVSGQGELWSPYQRLEVSDLYLPRASTGELMKVGYNLNIQQVFYQRAIDLSPQFLSELNGDIPELDDLAFSYNLPYRLGPPGGRVLIVGAGMGNDAAAALRNDAGAIDAVEIDPVILDLGRQLHPERPYSDPRVTEVVDDARSFLKSSRDRYDVIAFGLLDSHTLLSGLSNVRLDSFVYTLESFQQVRDHLKPGGVVAVTFATYPEASWIEERLGRMLAQVYGAGRVYIHQGVAGVTFIAGQIPPANLAPAQLAAWQPDPSRGNIPLTTDDWPYLYLRAQQVPAAYWQVLIVIGLACALVIARSFRQTARPDGHFGLLGAAFLLVEFKSVTEFALLFGTTWLVNALAISGVLLMVLAANLSVLRVRRVNLTRAYVLLFVSLIATFLFPLDLLTGLSPLPRALVSMIVLSLPLFFAALIFSESMRRVGDAPGPLASNLLGSAAGGALEYGSLIWGIKSLYVMAAIVYMGAWLALRRKRG